jgi:hypothetical protein
VIVVAIAHSLCTTGALAQSNPATIRTLEQIVTLSPGHRRACYHLAKMYINTEWNYVKGAEMARHVLLDTIYTVEAPRVRPPPSVPVVAVDADQARQYVCTLFGIKGSIADWSNYDALFHLVREASLAQPLRTGCLTVLQSLLSPMPLPYVEALARLHSLEVAVNATQPFSSLRYWASANELPGWGWMAHSPQGTASSTPPLDRPVRRLRVGYLSSDFGNHPSAESHRAIFALHDRTRVEVFTISTQSHRHLLNDVIRNHSDTYVDVSTLTPTAAAEVVAKFKLHVLIDMNGHVGRLAGPIMSLQPAPVIICALGYWGPCAAPWSPYVLADATSASVAKSLGSTLTVLYMPHHVRRCFCSLPPFLFSCIFSTRVTLE